MKKKSVEEKAELNRFEMCNVLKVTLGNSILVVCRLDFTSHYKKVKRMRDLIAVTFICSFYTHFLGNQTFPTHFLRGVHNETVTVFTKNKYKT